MSDTVASFGALPFAVSAIGGPMNCVLLNSADFIAVLPPPQQSQCR